MIKSIKTIENFGIYKKFNWNDELKHFNERNILYGWNYSGKTTLSRVFSSLRDKEIHKDFKDSKFSVCLEDEKEINEQNIMECDLSVSVFNSEYVDQNLKWETNEDLKGILFEVGESGKLRERILEKQKTIANIKDRIVKWEKNVKEFEVFENKRFTDKAREIKRDHFHNMIDFNKVHLKSLLETLSVDKYEKYILDNDKQVKSLKTNVLQIKPKDILPEIKYENDIESIINEVRVILENEPEESEVISILEENIELYHWVEKGKELHERKSLKQCVFCDNPIGEQRLSKLNKYYTNQSSLLIKRINEVKAKIKSNRRYIENFKLNYSKNDFDESLQSEYDLIVNTLKLQKIEYLKLLDQLDDELNYKTAESLYEKMETESYQVDSIEAISDLLIQTNDLIGRHNKYVEEFATRISTERKRLQKHLVALFLKEENYYDKQILFDKSNRRIRRLNGIIENIQKEIEKIEEGISSINIGKTTFENYIQMLLSNKNITIDIVEESKFKLMRHGKIAKNLSEGEKTAISFAYFLVYLENMHERGLLANEIIFIDDPISSLDSQHIAQVYSLINNFFFRKGQNVNNPEEVVSCFRQLFISTHNFEFFSFLKDSSSIKRKKRKKQMHEFYLIKRGNNDSSTIENLPTSLLRYKSEYVYLFKLIHDYYEEKQADSNIILLPNAIRRFLEMYTLTKLPGSLDELDGRMMQLYNGTYSLKALHHFSHFNNFEKLYKYDEIIMHIPQAVGEILEILQADKTHYESLKKAIS